MPNNSQNYQQTRATCLVCTLEYPVWVNPKGCPNGYKGDLRKAVTDEEFAKKLRSAEEHAALRANVDAYKKSAG